MIKLADFALIKTKCEEKVDNEKKEVDAIEVESTKIREKWLTIEAKLEMKEDEYSDDLTQLKNVSKDIEEVKRYI